MDGKERLSFDIYIRDKLIQTRDLQARDIVYTEYILRIYAMGGFIKELNFVFI